MHCYVCKCHISGILSHYLFYQASTVLSWLIIMNPFHAYSCYVPGVPETAERLIFKLWIFFFLIWLHVIKCFLPKRPMTPKSLNLVQLSDCGIPWLCVIFNFSPVFTHERVLNSILYGCWNYSIDLCKQNKERM